MYLKQPARAERPPCKVLTWDEYRLRELRAWGLLLSLQLARNSCLAAVGDLSQPCRASLTKLMLRATALYREPLRAGELSRFRSHCSNLTSSGGGCHSVPFRFSSAAFTVTSCSVGMCCRRTSAMHFVKSRLSVAAPVGRWAPSLATADSGRSQDI